jgi:hypothetical protein
MTEMLPAGSGTPLDLSREAWGRIFHLDAGRAIAGDDVAHSDRIRGGFRLSAAGPAGAARSATVHLHDDRDRVTVRGDGSYTVVDDGRTAGGVAYRSPAVLSGGATVAVERDGTVAISADGEPCRATRTLLRGTGTGVDVAIEAGLNPYCELPPA